MFAIVTFSALRGVDEHAVRHKQTAPTHRVPSFNTARDENEYERERETAKAEESETRIKDHTLKGENSILSGTQRQIRKLLEYP